MKIYRVKYKDKKGAVCISRIKADSLSSALTIAKSKYDAVKILESSNV